ncbi:MAG TPA: hypothetical protein DEE98_02670 [Elusimicrobia bacterium]|nr:MAG: hypothetical protein A2278_07500 [Elusimicrobia bacterium RIFOXYA12_FULL_49_49]OGS10329.1 MAG: hypothetical protein A2204_07370 [Elusimicrobia bacterium RIFOXYA1_FULL_47_7]OGS11108.1 MAG: hypothetical protein A2386_05790 [Elusimicrobia bacterium RIFOXYB1_FULL_48_9]OGS16089.1 MAG: hypothetical protein A2251_02765 [Elusimicrobia bacterium RIFOXYA2_FULL_47_53]OGS26715.1 MAG: hypothetical protein A2339_03815 [Elusimicrobia bacterium RIFOXYB12_FULL_50_12]OGS30159.1 MAG: hypothetical protein
MKKKIFLIITRLDAGGSSEAVLAIKNGLSEKYDISVLSGPGDRKPDILVPSLQRETNPVKDLRALIELINILKEHRPDIVQTNTSKAGFIGRWAAKFAGINRIIHMPHGHVFYGYEFSGIKTKLFLLLEKLSAPITGILIALTQGEKNESLLLGVGKPEQWEIVHPCVDKTEMTPKRTREEVRRELNIPDSAVVIGCVARLVPVKGVIYLVEAAALLEKLAAEETRYLVVGDGPLGQEIKSKVFSLGLTNRFIFTGMRNDVPDMMSAMDIYVQPSLNEGMGKTLVQAHAAGLPIVASRVQGIPDVVAEGKTGFLVPPADALGLSEKISALVSSPELRKQMGGAGKESVLRKENGLEYFGKERMLYLIDKIYENISR